MDAQMPRVQYDNNRLVNIGTNRWAMEPELGISKAVGSWTLELTPAVSFYTDNDDILDGRTRAQDPLYSVQGQLIYNFRSGIWVALDGTYYTGGQATIDGVEAADRRENMRAGLTVALPIDRHNSVKLYASTGVSSRAGGDFDAIGVAWQYRWGGRL